MRAERVLSIAVLTIGLAMFAACPRKDKPGPVKKPVSPESPRPTAPDSGGDVPSFPPPVKP